MSMAEHESILSPSTLLTLPPPVATRRVGGRCTREPPAVTGSCILGETKGTMWDNQGPGISRGQSRAWEGLTWLEDRED